MSTGVSSDNFHMPTLIFVVITMSIYVYPLSPSQPTLFNLVLVNWLRRQLSNPGVPRETTGSNLDVGLFIVV
jgi:hypothetical protein